MATLSTLRRFLWCALVFMMLAGRSQALPTKLGDLDGDGVFTVIDLAQLVGHSTGTAPLSTELEPFADINKDSFINDADQAELVKLILGTSTPEDLPLAVVQSTSPLKGESNVAVTRETVLHFSMPLAATPAIDTTMLHADFGGRKILSRVELSSDRKKATLFFLEPLPSNARVQVTFDSTNVKDLLGRPVDGDGDGSAGGAFTTVFDTISITPLPGTAISGRVFASERATGGMEVPLAGVTITVDGAEETSRCVTDAMGNFTLSPCPAGSFFVHIDGRTSPQSDYPNGSYYPSVGKRWEAIAGTSSNLSGNSEDTSRGTIYLPLIETGSLHAVSQTQDTSVAFSASVLAANPELLGTQVMVPANSLFADDGTRGGKVGIAPVAPDRLPSPLPPGLELPMVITIQTDGGTNFDRPVPVRFPNLPDPVTGQPLPPGAKSALWSFNHDTGQWEIVGPMTVTADGLFIVCDAGVGVRQPGWHGTQPGTGGGGGGPPPPPPPSPPCRKSTASYVLSAWDLAKQAYDCAKSISGAKAGIDCAINAIDAAKALIVAVNNFQDQYKAGTLGTVDGAETTLNIIKGSRDQIVGLMDCYKSADPLGKARAAFNCIGNLLAACVTICDAMTPPANAPPSCNPPKIQVTVCKGLGVASNLHAVAKTYVDLAIDFEEKTAKEVAILVIDNAIALAQSIVASIKASQPPPPPGNFIGPPPPVPLTAEQAADFVNALKSILESTTAFQTSLAPFKEIRDGNGEMQQTFNEVVLNASDTLFEYGGGAPRPETFHYLLSYSGQSFRGKTGPGGQMNVIMPPKVEYSLSMYCPSGMLYGTVEGLAGENGSQFNFNRPVVTSISSDPDADNDGLPDRAELVMGSDPQDADSDNDGVSDGAEAQQGTNPLDGLIATTGIVAAVPTSSPAIDVCAVNNMAVTANGNAGISVFNALSGLNPTRIADVGMPGTATAVASNGSHVAVASYQSGLSIVDVSKPGTIALTRQLGLGSAVQAVAVNGPLAYAGTAQGKIVVVDLASGIELGRLNLPGPDIVQDLAIWRDTLYALQSGRVTAIDTESLTVGGSLSITGGMGAGGLRLRIFAGEGTLYVTHTGGFNVIDISASPLTPTLVRDFANGQFGWRHLVANGTRLALAATGPNSTPDGAHDVDLYGLGNDERTPAFVTTFPMPGAARAVAIYNGLGYVAAETAGLQVLSYKPYDTLHVAPAISLSSNVTLNNTTKTGTIEEGKTMRLTAVVTDDVQVRNVEFYLNDELQLIDGNYPFEQRFTSPAIGAVGSTFKIKARATDTGGNAAWSDEYTITLVADATPPVLRNIYPGNNSIFKSLNSIYATFNEPMNPDSFTSTSFKLVEAGADKVLGTSDDVIPDGVANYRENTKSEFMDFAGAGLPPGLYRFTVQAPVADVAGNQLVTGGSTTFRVYNASVDTDNDGIPDDWESLLGLNPLLADSNGDGINDGRGDFDFDGLANAYEFIVGSNPMVSDTDGNGIADGQEDADGDGLSDSQEFVYGTSPFIIDTDGDGQDDATEIVEHTNPLVANARRITIQSAPVNLLNTYIPLSETLTATSGTQSVASKPVVFINLKDDTLPQNAAASAASKVVFVLNAQQNPRVVAADVVSFDNTIGDQVTQYKVTSAVSPLVSFANVTSDTLPGGLPRTVGSMPVVYLNLPSIEPAPANGSSASPIVYFLNNAAQTASATPAAPRPPLKSPSPN